MNNLPDRIKTSKYQKFEDEILSTHCSNCDEEYNAETEECPACKNELSNETILENEKCAECNHSFDSWATNAWIHLEEENYVCTDCVKNDESPYVTCEKSSAEVKEENTSTKGENNMITLCNPEAVSNEMKSRIEEYTEEYKKSYGELKCFIDYKITEDTLSVPAFIPEHGDLDPNSEGARHGLGYLFGLAALLNVDKLTISIPSIITAYMSKNIFYKHGFEVRCSKFRGVTTFSYEFPKPSTLCHLLQNAYFKLMEYLKKHEEKHKIEFKMSECKITSGLPTYKITYKYLEGVLRIKNNFILSHDDKGLFLDDNYFGINVYLNEPKLQGAKLEEFLSELVRGLWRSTMITKCIENENNSYDSWKRKQWDY